MWRVWYRFAYSHKPQQNFSIFTLLGDKLHWATISMFFFWNLNAIIRFSCRMVRIPYEIRDDCEKWKIRMVSYVGLEQITCRWKCSNYFSVSTATALLSVITNSRLVLCFFFSSIFFSSHLLSQLFLFDHAVQYSVVSCCPVSCERSEKSIEKSPDTPGWGVLWVSKLTATTMTTTQLNS